MTSVVEQKLFSKISQVKIVRRNYLLCFFAVILSDFLVPFSNFDPQAV